MSKVIAFVNQKGGVGKTTTCISVGAALSLKGYKVLLIDLDPQGNLSVSLGIRPDADDITTYEVMKAQVNINAGIIKNDYDVLPTDIRLSGADIELASIPGREMLLKEAIEPIKNNYDYVLIDCPPSLSLITLNGLTACDNIIIPVQAEYLALNGMSQLLTTIQAVKKRLNPQLDIGAIVITLYDNRKNLNKEVVEQIKKYFPNKVLDTMISNNVALAEAPGFGKDIFKYSPKSAGAENYNKLCDEILEKER